MTYTLPTDREGLAALLAKIAGLIDDLDRPKIDVTLSFFVHDGSDTRPSNIPDDVRVLYFHSDDDALVVTNSNKLNSWAKVTKYQFFQKEEFRTFAKSKSYKAI